MLSVKILRVAEGCQVLLLGRLRDAVIHTADVVGFLRVVSIIEGALRSVMLLVCADYFATRCCQNEFISTTNALHLVILG